ncbi:MAG: glycogen synthase GlgA [Planctomycetota bacterium]
MRVLMVAAEATPYVKVGGLADVVGALPRCLVELGCDVELVLPGYRQITAQQPGFEFLRKLEFPYAGKGATAEIHQLRREDGVTVTVVDGKAAFDREGVYDDPETREGYEDNPERFAFFARAVAELALQSPPDILHVHDSHAALVPGLMKVSLAHRMPRPLRSVLTIHNLAYQMRCLPRVLFDIGFPPELFAPMSPLEFHGDGNFLKTGIHYADAITTVSERYSREIQTEEMGCGLEGLLRIRQADLFGILNGIDTSEWNPETDPHLAARYSVDDLRGKRACRKNLLETIGLRAGAETAVIGMIGRLAEQKGLDIFAGAAERLVRMDVRLAILGSGQEKYHLMLSELRRRHPEKVAIYLGFNDELAHRIEAGSDFFLMPSKFEPCGLNQMYSMRYGTIPIVRRTGGLADTVIDCDESMDLGTGFAFDDADPEALLQKVRAALDMNQDPARKLAAIRRGMTKDFSMVTCARKYLDLYRGVAT